MELLEVTGTIEEEDKENETERFMKRREKEKEAGLGYPKTTVYYTPKITKATRTFQWKKWFFIISAVLFLLVAVTIICVVVLDPQSDSSALEETSSLRRESIGKIIVSRVKTKIVNEAFSRNSLSLQEFLKRGQEILEKDLEPFISYLDPEFLLAIPDDKAERITMRQEINSTLTNYLNWVGLLITEEEILSSCTKPKSEKYVYKLKPIPEHGWSGRMIEEVRKQRDEYLTNFVVDNIMNITLISGRMVKFSEALESLQFFASKNSVVTIVASVVCMDVNFTKDITFAIFAYKWDFIGPVSLNLSGKNARRPDSSKKSMPGLHGGHGRFFLGVSANEISQLNVTIDGGNGSNGIDGTNGRNATGGILPVFSHNAEDFICEISNFHIENIQGENIYDTKIFDDLACPTMGTAGGPGGKGGLGGVAYVISGNGHKKLIGKNGIDGLHGKNGTNGTTTIRNACYISAWLTFKNNYFDGLVRKNYKLKSIGFCSNESFTLPLLDTEFHPLPQPLQKKAQNETIFNKPILLFARLARSAESNRTIYPIFRLLQQLEESPVIGNLTNTMSLISETEELFRTSASENVLKSFLNKVTTVLNKTHDPQEQKALQYLSATVRSSITLQQSNINSMPIVDIEEYLDGMIAALSDAYTQSLSMTYFNVSNTYAMKTAIQQMANGMIQLSEALNGSLADQLKNLIPEKIGDHRILQLLLSATKASSILLIAVADHLLNNEILQKYQEPLEESLLIYEELQQTYREKFDRNANKSYEVYVCAEMFKEHCEFISNGTIAIMKELQNTDKTLFFLFRKVLETENSLESLEALEVSFRILRQKIRRSLAEDGHVALTIDLLREQVADGRKLAKEAANAVIQKETFKDIVSMTDSNFVFENSEMGAAVAELKSKLENNLLRAQYNNAYNTYQLWAFPFGELVALAPPEASREELVKSVRDMKKIVATTRATVQIHDKDIKQGDFNLKNPFYTWDYDNYKSSFTQLLGGRRIRLQAKLSKSRHYIIKQAIKFREINIVFTGPIHEHLTNTIVEMTHSGISHYYFRNNETVMIGPPVTFEVGYGAECASISCVKLAKGDALLSPFTAWTIKLKSLDEKLMDLKEYLKGSDLHLIGKGYYVSEDS